MSTAQRLQLKMSGYALGRIALHLVAIVGGHGVKNHWMGIRREFA